MTDSSNTLELVRQLGDILAKRKICIAVAESCTGGKLAGEMTAVPGASHWFERGFVTYSNESKQQMLTVPSQLVQDESAVSEPVVRAMAEGAILNSRADVSVAITGIAGPGGGCDDKPVGTVWIAWAGDMLPTQSRCFHFKGDRQAVREQSIEQALQGLIRRCHPDTHPSVQYKGQERYFFALWPGVETAQTIYQLGQSLIKGEDCAAVPLEKLHLTLSYIGKAHPEFLSRANKIAKNIKIKSFTLYINSVNQWSDIKFLGPDVESVSEELVQLQSMITRQLISLGWKPERKPFMPHITIARHCQQNQTSSNVKQINWDVYDVCLVKSLSQTGGSKYQIIARWPLA